MKTSSIDRIDLNDNKIVAIPTFILFLDMDEN